ncbi:hypothetical protein ACQ4PT_046521 [Festuca glaucescens]
MASRSNLMIAICESVAAGARFLAPDWPVASGLGSRLSLCVAVAPDLAVAAPSSELSSLAPLLRPGAPRQIGASPVQCDVLRTLGGAGVPRCAGLASLLPDAPFSAAGSSKAYQETLLLLGVGAGAAVCGIDDWDGLLFSKDQNGDNGGGKPPSKPSDGFNQAESLRWARWISRNFAIDLSASDVNQLYAVLSVCTEVIPAADFMELLFSKFPNDGPDCGPLAVNGNRCADKPVAGNAGGNPAPEEDKNPQDESAAVKERTASGFRDVLSLNLDGIVVKNPAFFSPWCDKSLSSKKAAPSSSNDWLIKACDHTPEQDKKLLEEGSVFKKKKATAHADWCDGEDGKATPKQGAYSQKPQGTDPEVKTKLRHFQKLEDVLFQKAENLFKQQIRLDKREVLQDSEAEMLKEKREEVEKLLQLQSEERKLLDLKQSKIQAAASDLQAREAKLLKEKQEVTLGRKEVSAGKMHVADEEKRLATELAKVDKDKNDILVERRALQDIVRASELKKRSAVVAFLKALPRGLPHVATPFGEWLSLLGLLIVIGGVVVSGKEQPKILELCVNMLVNEVSDQVKAWQDRFDRASRGDGKSEK